MAFVNLLQAMYPVGAVYCSTVSTSPSSIIGGTWAQITNAVLRASTSIGYTGSDTHAITTNEMPAHGHNVKTGSVEEDGNVDVYWGGNGRAARSPSTTWSAVSNYGQGGMIEASGGGASNVACPTLLQLLLLVQNCVDSLAVM